MPFANKQWKPVTMHHVVWAWLCAERDSNQEIRQVLSAFPDTVRLLDAPDLGDADDNWRRLKMLYYARWLFLVELPPDTRWYEVRNLRDDDLDTVHAVNYHTWTDPSDNNELRKVCKRKKYKLDCDPSAWGSVVLWGHEKNGPFTIIEGNHRMTAYAGSSRSDLDIPVFVGLSSLRCHWHAPDKSPTLIQEFAMRHPMTIDTWMMRPTS